jgi:hypothetical protein
MPELVDVPPGRDHDAVEHHAQAGGIDEDSSPGGSIGADDAGRVDVVTASRPDGADLPGGSAQPGASEAEIGEGPTAGEDRPTRRGPLELARSHPLVLAALLSSVAAGFQIWWIWAHRHLGGFDPDETSYLASALRIQRSIDLRHPWAVVDVIFRTDHGITSPVLSVPFLLLGPRDPRTAMMLQPALLVFLGVAAAAITRHLLRRPDRLLPPLVATVWVVTAPTMVTAVQSYWYGLSAAAAMAGAVWALLTSDRGCNRRVWWFGVGIGLMLLARTMTLGYVPGLVLAGLVVAWPDRRGLRRVVYASALGMAIAAPWYLVNRAAIFDYLFSFGYGKRATLFGHDGFSDRLELRWTRFVEGIGITDISVAIVVALVVVGLAYRFVAARRGGPGPRLAGLQRIAFLSVVVVFGAGTAALLSTANNGVWFELPLVVLLVPALIALCAQLPLPSFGGVVALVMIGCLPPLPVELWLAPWHLDDPSSHYEWGFSEYDPRFVPQRRDEHATAAADWWRLSSRIERSLRRIAPTGDEASFVIAGNTHLWNANTIWMAAEMDPWNLSWLAVDTTRRPAERAASLTPRVGGPGGPERVLVIGVHNQILWPLDADVRSFLAQAERSGWRETERFEMPRGGHVALLRYQGG